jgi:bacillithiol biosynthesis deacetylase BshB1
MSNPLPQPVDILAFGPHPDDVELCAGGLMMLAKRRGQRVVIVDMTRGEAGTRGTPRTREREWTAASEMMGLVARENLSLSDAHVQVDATSLDKVTAAIRKWRPSLIVGPCLEDRHPDHIAGAELVRRAYYAATIAKGPGGAYPPHRPAAWVQYFGHLEPEPTFVLDISEVWEERLALAACYGSQVLPQTADETPTNIGAPDFQRRVESRFTYYGARIGAAYGEPYRMDRLMPMDDPVDALRKRGSAVL